MYLTDNDLINAKITAEGKISEGEIIKSLIKENEQSERLKKMIEGERYYAYDNDIYKKDFRRSTIAENTDNDEEITSFFNPNRSNHHNASAFHRVLVDQKVSYIIGRKPIIKAELEGKENKEFQKAIDSFTSEEFNTVLQELLIGASNKGFEAVHVYYDKSGKLRYCIVPAEEIIPIYDCEHENELEQLIRYYDTTVIKDGKKYTRKRVEWWTRDEVTYFVEDDESNFVHDMSMERNPCPHWWNIELEDGFEKKRNGNCWGRVPFIILKNNARMTTDLEAVKGFIDAYDLLSSEGTNDLLDMVGLYWVIQGYGGETASAVAKKLQVNKAVSISDSSGNVEAKQIDISMEARLGFMKLLRKDIFQFGQGVDTDIERLGSNSSGVALKFQYTMLELKAAGISVMLKKCINELLWYMIDDFNRRNGTDYTGDMVEVIMRRNSVTNDYEIVEMIEKSKGILSEDTLISMHPFTELLSREK